MRDGRGTLSNRGLTIDAGVAEKAPIALPAFFTLAGAASAAGRSWPELAAEAVDFVVLRENTEGAYVGVGGNFKRGTGDEVAVQEEPEETA